ncbi:MAG: hypothetical protein IPP51_14180 [Bacteroidetes bacterium]|nr:hypothetical protein [Bacteroidota bacterium]
MKKTFILFVLGLMIGFSSHAQITWEKLFSEKSTDVFRSVQEVTTGGYILAGYTADSTVNDSDAFAVRLNTSGDTIWTYQYNGSLSKKDLFYKVIETSDGGFIFCGYTNSVTGLSDDILILKLNSSGQLLWVKTTGGSGKDRAQDIIQIGDGTYFVTGYTTSSPALYYDAFLYHLDTNGDSLWFKRYGTALYEDANSVRALSNGGYLLGGQAQNGANGFDQYLIRTDSNGDTIWTKKLGTIATENVEHIAIAPNGFILAGSSSASGTDDGYLVKTDTTGAVLWTNTYGGTQPDDFHRVELTSDGGLVASGTTSSSGDSLPNMWIVKTNSSGTQQWANTYGGDNHDHGYSGQETSDGGYILCGHTGSFGYNSEDALVVKMGTTGGLGNYLTYSAVTSVINPSSTLCGGGNIQVSVIVRNFGNDTLPNVPVTCNITGSLTQTLTGTYNGALYPSDADTLVFTTPITTVAFGTYNFTFTTNNNNDVVPANNIYTTTITIDGTTAAPTATDASRCGNGTVTLGASGTGTIYWYNAASGGTQVATGTSYTTPSLSSTTTYYIQTGLNCPSARVPVIATINSTPSNPVTTVEVIAVQVP